MKKLWIYFKLRMIQFQNDTMAFLFTFIIPIIAIVIVGFVSLKGSDSAIIVNYIVSADSPGSSLVVEGLKKNGLLNLKKADYKLDEGLALIKNNKISFLLDIASSNGSPAYNIYYNIKDKNNGAFSYAIQNIIQESESPSNTQNVSRLLVNNKVKNYFYIFFPGIIGMILMIIGLTGFGNYILGDRDKGVFKKLKTIDVKPFPYLAGIALSRLLVVAILELVLSYLSILLFNFKFNGSMILAMVLVLLTCTIFLSIGLFVAMVSKSIESYSMYTSLIQYPFLIFGGLFFSLEVFPAIVQNIAIFTPLAAFTSAFQKILYDGVNLSSIGSISKELFILLGWNIVFVPLSIKLFKW